MLGRRGVLVLNAVAAIPMLPTVEADIRTVMSFVDFNEGHRYSDFVQGSDEVASYGIPALVAGKRDENSDWLGLTLAGLASGRMLALLSALGAGMVLGGGALRRDSRAEASA